MFEETSTNKMLNNLSIKKKKKKKKIECNRLKGTEYVKKKSLSLYSNTSKKKASLNGKKEKKSLTVIIKLVLYCENWSLKKHIYPSKVTARNVGDPGSIPGLGRSPGEGNGNPLQYSCLENPMDRGAW